LLTTILPTSPEHYDLTIKTDLQALTFAGTVEIHLNILNPVPSITLNVAAPLQLKGAVLAHSALKTESLRPATEMTLDEKRERVEIKFAGGEISPGLVKLGLRWEGELEASMMGWVHVRFLGGGFWRACCQVVRG
jgi:aminopeptidase 2